MITAALWSLPSFVVVVLGDAQAGLSVAAVVVVERFESFVLDDDARYVDDMYAEMRGMRMRRVGLGRRECGGSWFR